jgi:hypothetical protein
MARLDWCSCHSPTLLQALRVAITSCSKDLTVLVTGHLTSTEAPLAIAFVFLLTGIPTSRDILQFTSHSWRHWQLDLLDSRFGCVTGFILLTLTSHLAHCWTICLGIVLGSSKLVLCSYRLQWSSLQIQLFDWQRLSICTSTHLSSGCFTFGLNSIWEDQILKP